MGVAVVFPGQGTQRPGMGECWRSQPAWWVVDRAEEITGEPLARLLVDAPADVLSHTREAQLAVFLTSLVAWEGSRSSIGRPVAFAGHSLGQVTALVAAGALSLDEGIRLVAIRAEATQRAADDRPGGLVALLGADVELAEAACRAAPESCWIAHDNAPGQVVLGGTRNGLERASAEARRLGARRIVPLDVGGAFHTPLMDEAAAAFSVALGGTPFDRGRVPVVANTDARPHDDPEWGPRLVDHLVRPVRWRPSVETLVELGATRFVEVGPGSTLSGLVRRTCPDADTSSISTPEDVLAWSGS